MHDEIKKLLRTKIKTERADLNKEKKQELDQCIAKQLIAGKLLDKANLVLIYISTDIEVDTKEIIRYCFEKSITMAVPRCVGKRKMNFYYCNENTVFEKSPFGIYEPTDNKENMITTFENTVCVVPALSFDKKGYRLGYGGGFYDTFIAGHPELITVGICYNQHITDSLPIGKYDRHVDYIVTENNTEACNG